MTALILLRDWQESQIEFWRPIRGFSRYDISTFGRLRLRKNGKILNGSVHRQGYHVTTLIRDDGKRKGVFYHRAVAEAFLPNPFNLPEINHLTGCKYDARLGCFEWSTRLNNQQHAWKHGLISRDILARRDYQQTHSWRTFSDAQIIAIRERRARGESCESLHREFNVTNGCVSEIVRGILYPRVGGPRTFGKDMFRLSDDDVRTIRRLVATKAATQKVIARQFNIDPSDVSRIAARKRYAYVV